MELCGEGGSLAFEGLRGDLPFHRASMELAAQLVDDRSQILSIPQPNCASIFLQRFEHHCSAHLGTPVALVLSGFFR